MSQHLFHFSGPILIIKKIKNVPSELSLPSDFRLQIVCILGENRFPKQHVEKLVSPNKSREKQSKIGEELP